MQNNSFDPQAVGKMPVWPWVVQHFWSLYPGNFLRLCYHLIFNVSFSHLTVWLVSLLPFYHQLCSCRSKQTYLSPLGSVSANKVAVACILGLVSWQRLCKWTSGVVPQCSGKGRDPRWEHSWGWMWRVPASPRWVSHPPSEPLRLPKNQPQWWHFKNDVLEVLFSFSSINLMFTRE